tara:strand:- start:1694 stop:2119 length:426 start_codon:yes stop_codon:yes gene_type:complete
MSFREFEELDEGKKSLLNQDYASLSDENFKEYLKKDLCILFNPDLFIKKWNNGNEKQKQDLLIGYDYYLRNMKQENPTTTNFEEMSYRDEPVEIKGKKPTTSSLFSSFFKKTGGKKKSQKRKKTKRVRKSRKAKKSTKRTR